MSFAASIFPALVKGAAFETGRQALRPRNGLGFAAWGDGDWWSDNYYENGFGGGDGGGLYFDEWGTPWLDSWFGGGGDLPYYPTDYGSSFWPGPGISAGNPYEDAGQTLELWWQGFLPSIETSAPFASPQGSGGGGGGGGFWDWLSKLDFSLTLPDFSGGPSQQPDSGPTLPGYCPRGTYHPQNDPYACVPFPPSDPNAKKQAQRQQQQQQQAAAAARKAQQQQQDKQCPPDPQRRPVWRNPQTGKCELVPQCQPGTKFDSTTRRCLTAAQAKELYGGNNWWIWLLIGGGVLLIATRDSGGGRRR